MASATLDLRLPSPASRPHTTATAATAAWKVLISRPHEMRTEGPVSLGIGIYRLAERHTCNDHPSQYIYIY